MAGGTTDGAWLTGTEVDNPATGTWAATCDLISVRSFHTATLLPDGHVLIVGGWNGGSILAGAEVYDPATGTWGLTGSLTTARCKHTATLLPDGRVLIAVGVGNGGGYVFTPEVYDRGLGFQPTWQPTLITATSPLFLGSRLEVSGSGFRGYHLTEAASGNSQSSPTNYPLVQLRCLDSEQVR